MAELTFGFASTHANTSTLCLMPGRLARVDQVVEGTHRLLHGRVPVRAMVDVAQPEPLERHLHALEDVLP